MAPPTTEADTEEQEAEEEPSPRPPRTKQRLVAILTAVAVILGLVASVMTASYVRLRSDRDAADDDRLTVATTATQVVEAMFRVDAASDNAEQAGVIRALGTAPLIEQYEKIASSARELLRSLSVTSERAEVTNDGVFVGEIAGDQAQVVVVADLIVVGQVTRVVPTQYLRVRLVKLDGTWKVDDIENVNVKLAESVGADPPSSTDSSSSSG